MADASVSKTDVRKDVRVRLPVSAPRRIERSGKPGGLRRGGVRTAGTPTGSQRDDRLEEARAPIHGPPRVRILVTGFVD